MTTSSAVAAFHTGQVGGPLRSLEDALADLAREGELRVLVPEGSEPAPVFDRLGARVIRGPFEPLTAPGSPLGVAAALRSSRRDVLWFRGALRESKATLALAVTTTLPAFLFAARLERVPSILWVGELLRGAGRGAGRELGGRALLAAEARLADRIVACSEGVAAQFGASAAVTTILPPIGDYGDGDGAGFRRRHRIPAEAPCIAAVGNITRGRGAHVLLAALPRLLERHPDLCCVIEGEPFDRDADRAYDAELGRLASELGVAASVLRTSRTEPVADLYAAADVIVNPATTHPETFGRVALEAATAGTPSVMTRVGVLPDLHTDGATALLVPPDDAAALAVAVERGLSDRELGARLADGAAKLAQAASPARSAAQFAALVEEVLSS